jgi:hypothetical protein
LASVRSLDLSVAETDSDPEKTKKKVLEVSRQAVEDGAGGIVLGCAGMAGYAPELESKLNIKVLNPAAVALKVAEAMADLGLTQRKIGLFATPPEKSFKRGKTRYETPCPKGWGLRGTCRSRKEFDESLCLLRRGKDRIRSPFGVESSVWERDRTG